MECPVCIKKSANVVKCVCGYATCTACLKKYIESSGRCACMECNAPFGMDFMMSTTQALYSLATKLWKKKAIDEELALLPETQEFVEECQRIKRETYMEIVEISKTLREVERNRHQLNQRLQELNDMHENARKYSRQNIKVNTEKRKKYIGPCIKDKCNGFIDESYTCGICRTKICKKCREIVPKTSQDGTPEHVCNEETVQSIKAIESSTKPCPKCGVHIFKIEGCDQMWCVLCQTAFSYRTLAIETHSIHNPHYYEWMAANPLRATQNADPCGRHMGFGELNRRMYNLQCCPTLTRIIHQLHQHITHLREHAARTPVAPDFFSLRIEHLCGKITHDSFVRTVGLRKAAHARATDLSQILQVFCDEGDACIADALAREFKISREEFAERVDNVIAFCNEHLKIFYKRYNTVEYTLVHKKADFFAFEKTKSPSGNGEMHPQEQIVA